MPYYYAYVVALSLLALIYYIYVEFIHRGVRRIVQYRFHVQHIFLLDIFELYLTLEYTTTELYIGTLLYTYIIYILLMLFYITDILNT